MSKNTISEHVSLFADHVHDIENRIITEQSENITKAAKMATDAFQAGNNIFAFGPTHAGMFAEEMFYRAGGLAITNPLFHSGVTCDQRPITLTSDMESLSGYGALIAKESPLRKGDVLFIHSVAARNSIVIDMAKEAQEMGVKVVGIICMDYASHVTSRDPSGKMMQDFCDVVIDTCGDLGDASMTIPGIAQKVAPTSSILGSFIANCLVLQMCDNFLAAGITPPVFQSANVDGGGAYNAKLLEQYKDRIFYM